MISYTTHANVCEKDRKVLDVLNNDNEPALLALSMKILNVDVDFLAQLKEAYTSCNYFSDENSLRWKSQKIENSTDGLFRVTIGW